MRFQGRRPFQNGDRRSSRHFVALLRFDLYGKFNGLPEDHPKGYDDNSPVNLAHLFRDDSTRLLIVHGTADDNVHFQNTMEMVRALNKLGKQYDMMVYPDQNHSMMPDDMIHVREKMLRYTLENL